MSFDDVDVVTTATFGVMSGTAAILSIPVGEPGQFKGAREILLNDVPAFPGPCPNESVGLVEAILYGTASSKRDPRRYGGGHVFYDLVSGQEIKVTVKTLEGDTVERVITLGDLEFARMFTTRACFKNYIGIVNAEEGVVETIFSVRGLKGPYREASVSGCGELNPLENDPRLETIGVGTKVLLNGSVGYVTGKGTRSSRERPNLTLSGDMWNMKPECMGGFITSHAPDCMTSVAIPIPVTSEEILENLKILDEQIKLPIVAILDRISIGIADYGQVWRGNDLSVTFDSEACSSCKYLENCPVEEVCPGSSFRAGTGTNEKLCFRCGACISVCVENALKCNMGSIMVASHEVPITLRQSCRAKAEDLATMLKNLIYEGGFTLTDKAEDV
jgi:putative methanogenesis marker 16 metalloprotein